MSETLNRRGRRILASRKRKSPRLVITATRKGGAGKTKLALVSIDLLELHDRRVTVMQLDQQERLARSLGREIITLPTDFLRASRNDPSAGLRAFRPAMEIIERLPGTEEIAALDIGATLVEHFMSFSALSALDEDLVTMGIETIALVPALAEPEAIRLAAKTIEAFRSILPSVTPVFVENQRDGRFDELVPGSHAHRVYEEHLLPLLQDIPQITMPAVGGRTWARFERHHCRPLAVVGMDIPTVMTLTGLPRAEAKICRGDVAAWVAAMDEQLRPILGIEGDA